MPYWWVRRISRAPIWNSTARWTPEHRGCAATGTCSIGHRDVVLELAGTGFQRVDRAQRPVRVGAPDRRGYDAINRYSTLAEHHLFEIEYRRFGRPSTSPSIRVPRPPRATVDVVDQFLRSPRRLSTRLATAVRTGTHRLDEILELATHCCIPSRCASGAHLQGLVAFAAASRRACSRGCACRAAGRPA